jgi:hypothetical protein
MFWIARKVAGTPLVWQARGLAQQFLKETARAGHWQRVRLRELIEQNAASQFGRDHHFGQIQTPEDFRRHLPIRGYEGHEPYIRQVREGNTAALFGPGTDVLMFAMTSGTTATPKTIPITRQALDNYRVGWKIWGILAFDAHPRMLSRGMRPILQLVSDWREKSTAAGIPCGAITGLTAAMQNPLVRSTYCMPPATMGIKDVEAKYYTALRLSIHRDLGCIMAANPSTILGIARMGQREKETLVRDLYNGTLDPRFAVPAQVRERLKLRIGLKRRRTARRIEQIVERTGALLPRDYWPDLDFLANWTGGTMGAYLKHYADYFGPHPVRDIGLIASEGRFTIPVENGTPGGVLDYRRHYFEFIPEDQIDREEPETLGAADLVEGERYFILPTTSSGLYRYQIHDLVRCVGRMGEAPILEFLNKGAHFSSLAGEKLSEFQVVEAVNGAAASLGLKLKAYLMVPQWADPPYYRLLVEDDDLPDPTLAATLAREVEQRLCRLNLEYENRRDTLRLGPIVTRRIRPGSWQEFQRARLTRSGGTAEQYKQPCLLPDLLAADQFVAVDEPGASTRLRA